MLNIHSLGYPLVLQIFAYLNYSGMVEFAEAFPQYLQDEYFRILLESKGNFCAAWEDAISPKSFLLPFIPRHLLTGLLRRAVMNGEREKAIKLLKYCSVNDLVMPLKRALRLEDDDSIALVKDLAPQLCESIKIAEPRDEDHEEELAEKLYKALDKENMEQLKYVIRQGANICGDSEDREGTPLITAVEMENVEIVKLLIEEGADVDEEDENEETALTKAVQSNCLDIISLLLAAGANVHSEGETPLSMAAKRGLTEAAKMLIEAGSDVDAFYDNETPIMRAAHAGNVEMVRLLVEAGACKEEALVRAAFGGQFEIVKLAVKLGADANGTVGGQRSALMGACYCGHLNIVKFLIESCNANVNHTDKDGHSAIMGAALNGHIKCVRLLLKAGADIHCKDRANRAALSHAVISGELDVIKLILQAGGKLCPRDVIECIVRQRADLVDFLLHTVPEEERNAPPREVGGSALLDAVCGGRTATVKALIAQKVYLDATDNNGTTALMRAAYKGRKDIVQLLIQAGADLNVNDKENGTAVSYAVSKGHCDIVQMLMKAGAWR